ncbi:MAG TPA: L-seryl-tRNA(Sec) selenium transferase [Bacteroidales bacterium]|nr:L-seryl-tRNA(Sec) selenium transferase [Bacteroidales bacterium]
MNSNPEAFKRLPAVNTLLALPEVRSCICEYGKEVITFSIRQALSFYREKIKQGNSPPTTTEISDKIMSLSKMFAGRSLKKVINATGVIIHTNIGRAPFGEHLLADSSEILKGYSNLEFDLQQGARGHRDEHAAELLKFLTGAEDVLIVNNNAAAVMLILRTFARGREVIISRGELIEIGGSFRIPEIMAAADCQMVEVGTTNNTRAQDYIKAINENTSVLFKAHKSNYVIKGFTQEVELPELVNIGKQYHIPVVYDLGSGLLRKMDIPAFENEPDVRSSLEKGVDLVCFSGDKLLGGPQAGMIAGKKIFTDILKKEPMMRALRVCKATTAFLETACTYYLNEKLLKEKNMVFRMLSTPKSELKNKAKTFQKILNDKGVDTEIVSSFGQCGGGTMPDTVIESYAVKIKLKAANKIRSEYAEKMYSGLLQQPLPVLGILKQGAVLFDVLTLESNEMETVAGIISETHKNVLLNIN